MEAEKNTANSSASPALARRLVEQAIDRCAAIEHGRRLEAKPFKRYSTVLGTTVATGLLVFLLGPAYLRHGATALLLITSDVQAASPYRIDVKPGNTTVPRGSDQVITAKIEGFASDQAQLLIRKGAVNQPFEHVPMVYNQDTKSFDGMLFDLPTSIDYFVEAGGVRSSVFTMHAADLPYVKQIEMEYVFPAYTGLAPRKIENGGDIAAPVTVESLVAGTSFITAVLAYQRKAAKPPMLSRSEPACTALISRALFLAVSNCCHARVL